MKQLDVQIMGQGYLLGCPEGGESKLLEAVERVDTAMCKIRDAGKVKARDRIAVLAALNLAFDLSERPAAATRAAPASVSTGNGADQDEQLASLIQRLDATLGEDGRLI
jgi:cell division protein ZapA